MLKKVRSVIIKKNEPTINKEKIEAVCIDNFAMKKRTSYSTVMVDLNDGRIIDIIESRDKNDVVAWLSQFPNLKYGPRD
ncbi:transposase [Alkalihalobacillus sp. BA299]|uniref:transposase n=1 Tax=Alkalihalobacillus sp. BA299 TaxID=2815938 RepID=UPI001ADC2A90